MDFMFFITFTNIFVSVFAATGDHTKESNAELLERIKANEQLIKQLFGRVEYLETRVKEQQLEIRDLRNELGAQRRASVLEKLMGQRSDIKQPLTAKPKTKSEERNQYTGFGKAKATIGAVKEEHRIRRHDNEIPVAFFAGLSSNINHAGVNQTYVFDHAITNVGNGYNVHSGFFVAPVDGIYVFSVSLMSLYHVNGHARFFKNSQPVTWLYVNGAEGGYDTTSQTLVLQLDKGDDVSVHNMDADKSMAGNHYSTFAGFLLYETVSSSAIVGRK